MELATYIMRILFSNPIYMMSWGFNSPAAIENGLCFNVQGYLHTGKVSITLNGLDLFDIKILNDDGSVKKEENDVYADCLTNSIDALVERCDNYDERVKQDYGL